MTTATIISTTAVQEGAPLRVSDLNSRPYTQNKTFQAIVKGTGSVSATITIDVSNNGVDWLKDVITFTLAGTTMASEGIASEEPWAYYRARVTAISGTGATASLIVGV